jgi:carbon-monoxide dehydrogenase small subunit
MSRVSLEVNGTRYEADVEPRLLLADLLRDRLDLTGTHLGCEHGVCGTCTVQIDGKPARSCLTLAVQADGCSIRTVEGLAQPRGERLHPLQSAFHQHHALQCGYCTPGFLMSMEWLLPDLAGLTDGEVREMLAGNLCRCTGYQNIVTATQAAASELESRTDARGLERILMEHELPATTEPDRVWAALAEPHELLVAARASEVVASPTGQARGHVVVGETRIEGTLELIDLDGDRRAANYEIQAREVDGPGQVRGSLRLSLRGSRLVIGLDLRFVGMSAVTTQESLHALIRDTARTWTESLGRAAETPEAPSGSRLPRALVTLGAVAGAWWLVRGVRRRHG